MSGLETTQVQCPCCWETFEAVVDCSVTEQSYVEDCYVCCRPLIFYVQIADGQIASIHVEAEDQ